MRLPMLKHAPGLQERFYNIEPVPYDAPKAIKDMDKSARKNSLQGVSRHWHNIVGLIFSLPSEELAVNFSIPAIQD